MRFEYLVHDTLLQQDVIIQYYYHIQENMQILTHIVRRDEHSPHTHTKNTHRHMQMLDKHLNYHTYKEKLRLYARNAI